MSPNRLKEMTKQTEGNDLSAEDAWENASVPSGSTYVSL